MQLSIYLETRDLTDAQFAETLGIDRSSVNRMRRGLQIPNREVMQLIADATGGAVMPNDFFGISAPSTGEAA